MRNTKKKPPCILEALIDTCPPILTEIKSNAYAGLNTYFPCESLATLGSRKFAGTRATHRTRCRTVGRATPNRRHRTKTAHLCANATRRCALAGCMTWFMSFAVSTQPSGLMNEQKMHWNGTKATCRNVMSTPNF